MVANPTIPGAEAARAEAELPGFAVRTTNGGLIAYDPSYQVSGLAILAPDADELIARVRSWARFVADAQELGPVEVIVGGRPEPRSRVRGGRLAPDPAIAETRRQALPARVPAGAPIDPTGLGAPKVMPSTIATAREQGFTGDPCATCGAMQMVMDGKCSKCLACGATSGGCS